MSDDQPMKLYMYVEGLMRSALSQKRHVRLRVWQRPWRLLIRETLRPAC